MRLKEANVHIKGKESKNMIYMHIKKGVIVWELPSKTQKHVGHPKKEKEKEKEKKDDKSKSFKL